MELRFRQTDTSKMGYPAPGSAADRAKLTP